MMETERPKSDVKNIKDDEVLLLKSLSNITGFPVEFIQKELLIDQDHISLEHLRSSVSKYLDATFKEISREKVDKER